MYEFNEVKPMSEKKIKNLIIKMITSFNFMAIRSINSQRYLFEHADDMVGNYCMVKRKTHSAFINCLTSKRRYHYSIYRFNTLSIK